MRYVMALLAILLIAALFSTPYPVAAQGSHALVCKHECAFFRMLINIPTSGDLAADLAGLIALASTLLTLARFSQGALPVLSPKTDDSPDADLIHHSEVDPTEAPLSVNEVISIE